jgi:hypothetical protein
MILVMSYLGLANSWPYENGFAREAGGPVILGRKPIDLISEPQPPWERVKFLFSLLLILDKGGDSAQAPEGRRSGWLWKGLLRA